MQAYKKEKVYDWIVYYLVLGIIQALWTNLSVFPPTVLRLGMIVAVFAPIYWRSSLILFAIPFSMILRGNLSTDYQYLPNIYSYGFYILVELSAIAVHYKKLQWSNLKVMKPFVLLMFYIGFIDFIFNGEIGPYAIHIFIAILLMPFIRKNRDFHLLSASLIMVCAILAIYYIIMFDNFLETWSKSQGIERSGWNDPNYFSTLLDYGFLVAIMYLMGYLKSDLWIFNKVILMCVSVAIFAAVVMTASRAGFLCFVILFVVVAVTTKMKWYWYLLGSCVVWGVILYMYNEGTFDVLLYRFFEQGNLESGGDRTNIWELGISNFFNQDFSNVLLGGGYWHRVNLTNGKDLHNEFVSILLDYGLIGIFLFMYFILSSCSFGIRAFVQRNISVLFFVLALMSLSPFQNVYICFLAVWLFPLKKIMSKIRL